MPSGTSGTLTLAPAVPEVTSASSADSVRWGRWAARAGYGLLAIAVLGSLAFNIFQPIKVLPRVHLAPGFALRDAQGTPVNSENYRGRITVYGFTTPACDGCPDTDAAFASLQRRLSGEAPEGLDLSIVSLVLGSRPEDGGSPIADDRVRWDVLDGDQTTMKYIVGGGFGQYYELVQTPAGAPAAHFDPMYVLVDGWGIVRAEYRNGLDEDRVLRDLRYLAQELGHQEGIGRLAYEAAHLFRCYP